MGLMPEMVAVEIKGKAHHVPAGTTVLSAMWYAGYNIIRGVGCLGGVCGACTIIYTHQGSEESTLGLGCMTLVEEGMSVALIPELMPWPLGWSAYPDGKPTYHQETLPDQKRQFLELYPEAVQCRNCNACNKVCPQDIPIKETVWKAADGQFDEAAEMYRTCIMCGLCISVCPAEMKPSLYGLYARRAHGMVDVPRPPMLITRIEQIQSGQYDSEWSRLLAMSEEELTRHTSEAAVTGERKG